MRTHIIIYIYQTKYTHTEHEKYQRISPENIIKTFQDHSQNAQYHHISLALT